MAKINKELAKVAYDTLDLELGLSSMDTIAEKVQALVISGDKVMGDICEHADIIKIHMFETISEQFPELGIPNGVWLELVNLRRLKMFGNLPESVMDKIANSYLGAKNVTAFRESAISSIASDATMTVPTVDVPKKLDYSADTELNEEFKEILDNCATIRHKLDNELWPKLRTYGDAFTYVTEEPWAGYKFLLDMYHYRNGGWPSDKTPPRVWSIINRFAGAYRSMSKYGFGMMENWCQRFGLDIKLSMVSPTIFNFGEEAAKFGKYTMLKIKDVATDKYTKYGIQPWHHLIIHNGLVFGYIWDSREIEVVQPSNILDISDCHTDYVDSCAPLRTNNPTIIEYAKGMEELFVTRKSDEDVLPI